MTTILLALSAMVFWIRQNKITSRLNAQLADMRSCQNSQNEIIKELLIRSDPFNLDKNQQEFKDEIDKKWQNMFAQLGEHYNAEVEKCKDDFSQKIADEYQKACEAIAFHTVEYKKTITKKRKQTSRKTKATKPQKQYRSIDDE